MAFCQQLKVFTVCAALLSVAIPVSAETAKSAAESGDSKELSPAQTVLEAPQASVSVEDIERYIVENLPPEPSMRQGVLNRPGIYREMAENLFIMRALAAEAEAAPDFDEEQARWAGRMAYQRQLVKNYRTRFIRENLGDVDWEAAAREHYIANPERYQRQERISAAHILIKTDERSVEEAQEIAEELYERIAAGEDFAALAVEYSEDGSAPNGGELGYFQRGKMVPEFEDAAFALAATGDVSEPVKSSFGFHIIQLKDRKPAGTRPFDEVKKGIIDRLQRQKSAQLWQDKLVRLRSGKDIRIDQAVLQALRDEYATSVESLQQPQQQ